MATQDTSPSLIIGKQWSLLADLITSAGKNDEECTDKDGNTSCTDTSMKLGSQDMSLFGFCPLQDEFSLVVCEKCNLLVKPQSLKQHIESRHGPTNLSSLGTISASALNSELGKKLLMPLAVKPMPPPTTMTTTLTSSQETQSSANFKPLSFVRPPTKASLKQVPLSVKTSSAPVFGVGMKINITKPVKSGNRVTPTKPVISNPVVKMEKLDKLPATTTLSSLSLSSSTPSSSSSLLFKPVSQQQQSQQTQPDLTKNIFYLNSTKISTLVNGSVRSVIPTVITTLSTVTTTSFSVVSNPMLSAVTKTSTDTPVCSRNVTTFVNTSSITKPILVAPIMTVGPTNSIALRPVPVTKNMKLSKDHKERKFLPCKDREYDANKHCGVVVSETGKSCTRSLTCKTHALSLRRAVIGRCKSFDDLLKEHKAAKELLLKAKAESQNIAATTVAASKKVLVSPATINSALNVLKQQMSVISQYDGKFVSSTGVLQGNARPPLTSNTLPSTVTQFVRPHSASDMFQRFTSSAILPPSITVKEEVGGSRHESSIASSRLPLSSPEQSHSGTQNTKLDHNFFPHHPRPIANNNFGGRLNDKGCVLFSRKMDYMRAALLSALERQLNPPPHKKLCVESNLPKESQTLGISKDPYEFNLMDTSGGGVHNLNPALINSSKPLIKSKSKPISPASVAACQPFSFNSASVSSSLSLSSSLCTPPVDASTSLSSSGILINRSIKSWDNTMPYNPSTSPSSVLTCQQFANSNIRKQSASSNCSFMSAASSNGALSVTPAVSLGLTTANTTGNLCQQPGILGVITPASLSSHQTGHLIAIPSVSLSDLNLGQQTTSTLGNAKINTSLTSTASATSHKNNNIFKDFNFVLTGLDPCLVNGQYVNITGAQLTELATGQGQTLFLNSYNPGRQNCAQSSDVGINLATTPMSRPIKRSRSSASKPHQTSANSDSKITASALEGYKLIPTSGVITSSSLPPSSATVLMDSGRLQDAVFTLATGGSNPTLVAIASSAANTTSSMVPGNSMQVICSDSSSLVNSSTLVNGVSQSHHEKSGSNSQRHHHHHHHHSSSSKTHHQHHHHHHQQKQQHSKPHQQQELVLGSILQGAPSIAFPIPPATAPQLCSSQVLLKPASNLNLTTKNLSGKLTMQPVSLTFPITVGTTGLAALPPDKPQQTQHKFLVNTTSSMSGDTDPASVMITGTPDLHLQSQLSNTSTNNLIS